MPERETAHLIAAVADVLKVELGSDLLGLYGFGSLAWGEYIEGVSDVDLLAVTARAPSREAKQSLVRSVTKLVPNYDRCAGVDFYLITEHAARRPSYPPEWELAVGVFRSEGWQPEVDFGEPHGWQDATPTLAAAIIRERGQAIVGQAPQDVFDPIPPDWLRRAIVTELDFWLGAEPIRSGRTAVLNACRAWFFAVEGRLTSKLSAGRWARSLMADPSLIEAALAAQHGSAPDDLDRDTVRRFVAAAKSRLST